MSRPGFIEVSATVLGAPDPSALARFYSALLGWPVAVDEGDWAIVREPHGGTGLSFQHEPGHEAPTWPPVEGEQQMMMHLDVGVDDLDTGVAWALECGATLAAHQPQEGVRVMVDPVGHHFCLFPVDG